MVKENMRAVLEILIILIGGLWIAEAIRQLVQLSALQSGIIGFVLVVIGVYSGIVKD